MSSYIIKERIYSRKFDWAFGQATEERIYTVQLAANAPDTTLVHPAIIPSLPPFPNVGGSPSSFKVTPGMKHPDAYAAGRNIEGLYMRLEKVSANFIRRDTPRSLEIHLYWRNFPNPAGPQWSFDMSLNSEQVTTDIDGQPIKGPQGESITVARQKPQPIERCTIAYARKGEGVEQAIEVASGATNARYWRRHDRNRWMMIGGTLDPVDDEHVALEYSFQFDPEKWETVIQPLDQNGDPDPAFPQGKRIKLYGEFDFRLLPGINTRGIARP